MPRPCARSSPCSSASPTSTAAPTGRCRPSPWRRRVPSSTRPSATGARPRTSSAASSCRRSCRGAYARLLGRAADDIALTTSTSDGLGRVLAGLDLGSGDEIVTSDQEHPGPARPAAGGAPSRRHGAGRPVRARGRGGRAGDDPRGDLARELDRRRGGAGRAGRARRAGDPRRRAGRGRDPRRPVRARLRRLRRVGPEVALRRRRHRAALDRSGIRREGRAGQPRAT